MAVTAALNGLEWICWAHKCRFDSHCVEMRKVNTPDEIILLETGAVVTRNKALCFVLVFLFIHMRHSVCLHEPSAQKHKRIIIKSDKTDSILNSSVYFSRFGRHRFPPQRREDCEDEVWISHEYNSWVETLYFSPGTVSHPRMFVFFFALAAIKPLCLIQLIGATVELQGMRLCHLQTRLGCQICF